MFLADCGDGHGAEQGDFFRVASAGMPGEKVAEFPIDGVEFPVVAKMLQRVHAVVTGVGRFGSSRSYDHADVFAEVLQEVKARPGEKDAARRGIGSGFGDDAADK